MFFNEQHQCACTLLTKTVVIVGQLSGNSELPFLSLQRRVQQQRIQWLCCRRGPQTTQGLLPIIFLFTSRASRLTSHFSYITPFRSIPLTTHLTPRVSNLQISHFKSQMSHLIHPNLHFTPHTSPLHAMSQTSYLKRKTGKLARIEWHGDDVTDPGLLPESLFVCGSCKT